MFNISETKGNMSTSRLEPKVLETRYVWGSTIQAAMNKAFDMEALGWVIEGHPAPMTFKGDYGTGVAIVRICND